MKKRHLIFYHCDTLREVEKAADEARMMYGVDPERDRAFPGRWTGDRDTGDAEYSVTIFSSPQQPQSLVQSDAQTTPPERGRREVPTCPASAASPSARTP